ncbi:unnamed protein product [Amaranthus hypochondriacus]
MSLNCCFLPKTLYPQTPIFLLKPKHKKLQLGYLNFPLNYPSFPKFTCQLNIRFEDIITIAQNKVLIAAGVSAAVGQLAKPFTSVWFYGKDFDLKTAIQAGGFPSTHSSAVIAAATCLALERGFSDSLFGMSVVYAGLVMYDAQGVRREVGIHARTLNRRLLEDQMKSAMEDEDIIDSPESAPRTKLKSSSFPNDPNDFNKEQATSTRLLGSRVQRNTPERTNSYVSLKESIGHTEVEVIAGGVFGLLVSLIVNAVM